MKHVRTCLVVFILLVLATAIAAQTDKTAPAATSSETPKSAASQKPLAVGEMAPDFTLPDQDGNSVTLSAARGKTPVVLVFYRGYW